MQIRNTPPPSSRANPSAQTSLEADKALAEKVQAYLQPYRYQSHETSALGTSAMPRVPLAVFDETQRTHRLPNGNYAARGILRQRMEGRAQHTVAVLVDPVRNEFYIETTESQVRGDPTRLYGPKALPPELRYSQTRYSPVQTSRLLADAMVDHRP